MIHSMAGGVLKENQKFDFAKVKLENGQIGFFICQDKSISVGDFVLVPFGKGDVLQKAEVLRIDKNVSEQVAPFPIKRMKKIFSKCEK